MKTLRKIMDKFLEAGVVVSISAMIVVVAIQVLSRFALPKAPYWTEEAARIFFIFMVSFAAGLAMRDRAFVSVDTFLNLLPAKAAKVLQVIICLVITFFMSVTLVYSITFIKIGAIQRSPSLGIPMSCIFASTFILSLFICVYSLIEAWDTIKELKTGRR